DTTLWLAKLSPSKLPSKHLMVNWLSERGEYSKAVIPAHPHRRSPEHRLFSTCRFLFSDFPLLSLQLRNGDGLSSVLLGLKRIFLNQWMRGQELANPPAECACSVAVNNSDARLARQRGIVQKFVQAIGGFFHGHADDVAFVIAADVPALRSHRHAL